MRLEIPLMRYEMAVSGHPPARGVMPDVPVTPTIGDIVTGRDAVLERALELARSGK